MTFKHVKYPYLPLRLHTDTKAAHRPVSPSSVAERPLAVPTLLVRPQTPKSDNEASVRAQYDIETTKILYKMYCSKVYFNILYYTLCNTLYNTIHFSTLLCSILYCHIHYVSIQYSTMQYNAVSYYTLLHNIMQYITVHYITIQYITIQ
jgi:hypothetical protein